jgi:hypothetical protein
MLETQSDGNKKQKETRSNAQLQPWKITRGLGKRNQSDPEPVEGDI